MTSDPGRISAPAQSRSRSRAHTRGSLDRHLTALLALLLDKQEHIYIYIYRERERGRPSQVPGRRPSGRPAGWLAGWLACQVPRPLAHGRLSV